MTPADHQLIKHAQKELVALCGGLDAVSIMVNRGRSTVGRWADVGDPALMPMQVFVTLQKHCRTPVVTAALAAAENRTLADAMGDAAAGQCLFTAMAETMVAIGSLSGAYGLALADHKITPNELTDIDGALAKLQRDVADARKSVASARADGGLRVVGGV
jgi:hypothetical protein